MSINLYRSLVSVAFTIVQLAAIISVVSGQTDLTFAESMYVKMSSACRAVMDLSSAAMIGNDDIKTIKIKFVDKNSIMTYPINEAFSALTQPAMFDISKQTKIIIHGYKDSSQSEVPMSLAQAYNDKKIFNVILVDAEVMLGKWYFWSVYNAKLVGKRLGNLIANIENFGASAEDIHLIGISLGAHIAGWAGKYFRQYKGKTLGHITGLDPAGPCFSHSFSDQRLDKTDATYVDVIHSNRLVQGVIEDLGHADFYLNGGGPSQPGCFSPSCSHLRAAKVYIESVRSPKSFVGVRCVSWKDFLSNNCEKFYAILGYGSSFKNRGLFFLRTAEGEPLGLGMEGTKSNMRHISYSNLLLTLNLT